MLLLLTVLAALLSAQAPESDVYLAPITWVGDSLVIGEARNLTHRAGYDNQPSFTADSRAILYTAQRDGQTDIWRYDIAEQRTLQLTKTPESEYSPQEMPGSGRFSVVRVELDSTQRLWSFAPNGRDPQLVLPDVKRVGYYAWLDSARIETFVLGTPNTLHILSRFDSRDTVVARNVGRALLKVPSADGFSFTQRDSAGVLTLTYYVGRFTGPRPLVGMPDDNEHFAATPDGEFLTASHGRLLRLPYKYGVPPAWVATADLAQNGLKNVSRLAVSPNGKWLVFVAEPSTP